MTESKQCKGNRKICAKKPNQNYKVSARKFQT